MADRRQKRQERPMRRRRKKPCVFCADKKVADYKNIDFMKKFVTDRGKIAPRRMSGCCAKHQRLVATEIKRARQIGLLPFTVE
ncbi:30S ribosomal protein S18 [Candidatus Margulisiibacteriota bacterium]